MGVTKRGARIRRSRSGKEFRYTVDGRVLRDAAELRRIEELAIPPAWDDVTISRSPRTKVLASGIDAAGRRQSIYHPTYRRGRDREKFARMERFAAELPRVRRRVRADLRTPGNGPQPVIACVVRILDRTSLRIGSRRYVRERGSYGLTTLRKDHVRVRGTTIHLNFPGKSGRQHDVVLRDRAAILKRRGDAASALLGGQRSAGGR